LFPLCKKIDAAKHYEVSSASALANNSAHPISPLGYHNQQPLALREQG